MPTLIRTVSFVVFLATPCLAQDYDVVLRGGRVMDPETNFDAVRDVAIANGHIAVIGEDLRGDTTIDCGGLVVAPGFIDLHAHGQAAESRRLQANDGVTTALELEIGVYPVAAWYEAQEGTSLINYGATVSHLGARVKVKHDVDILHSATASQDVRMEFADGQYAYEPATDDEIERLSELLTEGIADGALGVGFGIAYTPAATHSEIFRMFQVAARERVPCYVHMRDQSKFDGDGSIAPLQEVIANAAATGASLHVVHVNSSGGALAKTYVEMIRGARAQGVDVTTECYPYAAGSTLLQSALFDNMGTPEAAFDYSDIMWVQTGERLTEETFEKYREIGGWVVIFSQDPEMIAWLVAQPDIIIASDGIPFVGGLAHPRGAGTFSRVLGRHVREKGELSLMDALRKMTLLPAQRVERVAPMMKRKGRIQTGCDADIVVFAPDTIIDKATYKNPAQSSAGIAHVLVNGAFVVRDYTPVDNVYPGRPVLSARVMSP